MALKRMSIKVSEELYDYIAAEAEKEGLSMNAVIIFALNSYKTQKDIIPYMGQMKELWGQLQEWEKIQKDKNR